MQQGETLEGSNKEIEQNRAMIVQLQVQNMQLQTQLEEHDIQYRQVASNLEDAHQKQTNLLTESRTATTKSKENAKLHKQNFKLMDNVRSLTAKLYVSNYVCMHMCIKVQVHATYIPTCINAYTYAYTLYSFLSML